MLPLIISFFSFSFFKLVCNKFMFEHKGYTNSSKLLTPVCDHKCKPHDISGFLVTIIIDT